jgi:hypothetical protein
MNDVVLDPGYKLLKTMKQGYTIASTKEMFRIFFENLST